MKNMKHTIQIQDPCQENWNNMTTNQEGKFCSSCQKTVHDFSKKTDQEIHQYLVTHSSEKVCGRFRTSQINRPLVLNIKSDSFSGYFNSHQRFIIAIFLVFGTFLFSCQDHHGKKIDSIQIENLPAQTGNSEYMLGETAIPQFDTTTEERIIFIPPIVSDIEESTIYMKGEVMVAGGISYIPTEEIVDSSTVITPTTVCQKDTTTEENPNHYILGGIGFTTVSPDHVTDIVNDSTNYQRNPDTENPALINHQSLIIFPNPSSGEFTIKYEVKKKTKIQLEIYDMSGSLIQTIIKPQIQHSGIYQVPVSIPGLQEGIYFCQLHIGNEIKTERIVIAK